MELGRLLLQAGHNNLSDRMLIIDELSTDEFKDVDYNWWPLDEICLCAVCKAVLLPDDEAYEDADTGEFLCDLHSVDHAILDDRYMKFIPNIIVKWERK